MNSTMKNLMFWMVVALFVFLFWSVSSRIQGNYRWLRTLLAKGVPMDARC